jgi:uncharacterized membrane protein
MSTNAVPAPAASGDDLQLTQPSRHLAAGAGVTWVSEGWKLFTKSPLMWIVAIVILFVLAIVAGLIPFIGQLAFQILSPVFSAGLVIACRSIEKGGEFELEHLFAGFRSPRLTNLVILGVIFLVAWVAVVVVVMGAMGLSVGAAILAGDPENALQTIMASSMVILLGVLVMLALLVPILAAYWFAPALIVMNGLKPVDAMKESFIGSFRNFLAFLVYGIVMTVLAIVALIPLGLGMLVWVPLAITSTYASYRAIFTEP